MESWDESLSTTLDGPLLDRWFSPTRPYRNLLDLHLGTPAEQAELEQGFRRELGARLPQQLRHQLLVARLER